LGGGTIIRPENVAILKEHCKVFFLRADVETLKLHLQGEQSQRPLLRSGGFEALLLERTPLYTAAADYIIDTDSLSPMQIAGVIANLVT
jgi:shikimate kinase